MEVPCPPPYYTNVTNQITVHLAQDTTCSSRDTLLSRALNSRGQDFLLLLLELSEAGEESESGSEEG